MKHHWQVYLDTVIKYSQVKAPRLDNMNSPLLDHGLGTYPSPANFSKCRTSGTQSLNVEHILWHTQQKKIR